MYPNMKVLDMTCSPTPNTSYGELASKNYNNFMLQYPGGMSAGQLFYELYNILSKEISESPYVKYENDRNSMQAFLSKHINKFGPDGMNRIHSVKEIITILINIESDEIQKNINEAQNNTVTDISDYDIILSTIHSASDIHCDNVIVFMKNNNDKIDEALYRVALTRADKSEYLIFANYGNFKTSYQRYIETHM
jgi:superfamily I DNA/RNA helicase